MPTLGSDSGLVVRAERQRLETRREDTGDTASYTPGFIITNYGS